MTNAQAPLHYDETLYDDDRVKPVAPAKAPTSRVPDEGDEQTTDVIRAIVEKDGGRE